MARKQVENIKITLDKSNADIELLPYMTAEIDQLNQAVYLGYGSLDMNQAMEDAEEGEVDEKDAKSAVKFDKLPASAIMEIKNNALRGFVKKIDGNDYAGDSEAILKELLTLPKEDIDQLHAKIDEIQKETSLDPKDKQKSA
jgi:hypothetical protein